MGGDAAGLLTVAISDGFDDGEPTEGGGVGEAAVIAQQ